MFHEKYEEIRTILSTAQSNILNVSAALNETNPTNGGPGLSPEQTHATIGMIGAEVHNLAFAVGNLVDLIEQDGN